MKLLDELQNMLAESLRHGIKTNDDDVTSLLVCTQHRIVNEIYILKAMGAICDAQQSLRYVA